MEDKKVIYEINLLIKKHQDARDKKELWKKTIHQLNQNFIEELEALRIKLLL